MDIVTQAPHNVGISYTSVLRCVSIGSSLSDLFSVPRSCPSRFSSGPLLAPTSHVRFRCVVAIDLVHALVPSHRADPFVLAPVHHQHLPYKCDANSVIVNSRNLEVRLQVRSVPRIFCLGKLPRTLTLEQDAA